MDVYLVRHAIAEQRGFDLWPDDSQRPLTERGREKFKLVAEVLRKMVPYVDAVYSSRFVRAWQTAEMLTDHADWPEPQSCPELEFASPEHVCRALAEHSDMDSIAIVGHEPSMSELTGYLLLGEYEDLPMIFKKGGVVHLQLMGSLRPASAVLMWYLTPKLAKMIGE